MLLDGGCVHLFLNVGSKMLIINSLPNHFSFCTYHHGCSEIRDSHFRFVEIYADDEGAPYHF